MTSALMNATDYAAHRGVGKSAVSNWKKKGLLVFAESDGQLLIDVARTDARVNATVDPTRGRPAKGAAAGASSPQPAAAPELRPHDDANQARLELIRANTAGKQLDNARRAGELVGLTEYEAAAAELGRTVRERMHSIVRQNAERIAAERDPRAIIALLGDEIDRAFATMADEIEAETIENERADEVVQDDGAEG